MSVLRDLIRLSATSSLLRPTAMLCTAVSPSTTGRTSGKLAPWCCSSFESSLLPQRPVTNQQARPLKRHSACESARCAFTSSSVTRHDVRCCCTHACCPTQTLVPRLILTGISVTAELLPPKDCQLSAEQLELTRRPEKTAHVSHAVWSAYDDAVASQHAGSGHPNVEHAQLHTEQQMRLC